jgi:VanZ like family
MKTHSFTQLARLAAWVSIVSIAFLTLAHVGLVYSIYFKLAPLLLNIGMRKYALIEHLVAFALFGALFCAAYPDRIFMVCFIIFGSALALEFMQTLTPDRHGTFLDAFEKIAGGACGICTTKTLLGFWRRRTLQIEN